MDNANSQEYLEKIKVQVIENLKRTTFAPSVQMTDVPRDPDEDPDSMLDDLDEDEHKDQRYTKRRWDKYVEKDGELSESDDEDENDSNGVRRQPGARKRRNMMDFQNPDAVMDDEDLGSGAVSPRRGRSRQRGAGLGGAHSTHDAEDNGSVRSSNAQLGESGGSSEGVSVDASPHGPAANEDEDVDMVDDSLTLGPAHAQPSADGPQEATPPDSPPSVAAAPSVNAQVADHVGNDAVDEGDTQEDPELAQEEGRQERENKDVAAEKSTGVADQAEL